MKKLILTLAVVFVTVGLSGCDLISQTQVDEISEQFCRDNPESEICEGDLVDNLTEEVILNAFNTIIDGYADEANETFCDDYFSVTNTELLDTCRESRASLVPAEYVGYTVSDVSRLSGLGTDDVYEVTVLSDDLTIEIVFTVGVVNVDGIMYINDWSYVTTDINPTDLEVTLEIAQAYFEQFLDDYLDPSLASADVCAQYFSDDDERCIEERDNSFDIDFDVVLNSMVPGTDAGSFVVEMTFSDTEAAEPKQETETVIFAYDSEGNIVMTFEHKDEEPVENWLNAEQAFEVINGFLNDYNGYDVSDNDFNSMYFGGQMDWSFFDDRNQERDAGGVLSLIMVEDPTEEPMEYLVVTMQRTYEGENKTMVVRLRVNDLGNGEYYFDILFDDRGMLDYDMLWNFMLDMIADYQDPNMSAEDVCYRYFSPEQAFDCAEHRQEFLDSGETIAFIGLSETYDYYEIQFEYSDGVDTWDEFMFANFYYDEFNELKVEFNDLGFDEINYDEALQFMENLVNKYSDQSLSSYDVCSQFFEGYSYDECIMRREQEMNEGIVLNGFELHHDGYGYKVEYFYSDSQGNTFAKNLNAYFYYNENGELRLEFFEDFQLIPYDEVYPFIEQLIADWNNHGINSYELCAMYFGPETAIGCEEKREDEIYNGITLQLFQFGEEYDHYRIEFEYTDSEGNRWFEVVFALFWYDDAGNLKVDFHGEDHGQFPYDEAYNYFQQLIVNFSNTTMSDYDFCNIYFPEMGGNNCLWDRSIMPLPNMQIWLNWMDHDGNNFKAEVSFVNNYNGDSWTKMVYMEFYYDEYGNIGMHIYEEPMHNYLNYNDAFVVIQQFIWDYNNPDISFDQMNAWYFDYHMDWQFEEERMDAFEIGRSFELFAIYDPYNADGQDWLEVLIDVYEQGVITETMTSWMRVMPMGNGFHMLEFKDDNEQNYVDISYDDAYNYMITFVNDYSNHMMSSYDVCNMYFEMEEAQMCMAKRDEELNQGLHVQLHGFIQESDGYYADFGFYGPNDEFLFNEYVNVFFYYGERGELKISFNTDNYQKYFDIIEAENYINLMFMDYYDPGMPSGVFCEYYGHIFPDCEAVRNTVLNNGPGNLYVSAFWHNFDNIFYLEYAYHLDGQPANYYSLELAFYYDEFGDIRVDVWNQGPNFNYQTYAEAIVTYEQFIRDYLDPAVTTEILVNTYFGGWMDDMFADSRAQDLVSGTYVDFGTLHFEDFNQGNGIDWITATFNVHRGDDIEFVTENFRVIIYDDHIELEMEHHNPDVIDYPVAYDFFNSYLNDFFDPTFSVQEFCDNYTEGWMHDECMQTYQYTIDTFGYIQIVDFYFDEHMYMYNTTVDYYDHAGVWMETRTFELYFWYDYNGQLRLELHENMHQWDPVFDELHNMMLNLEQDFTDPTISSVEFCDRYFMGTPDCIEIRDEVLNVPGTTVWMEDFFWYPDCDDDGYCTGENLFESRIFIDYTDGNYMRLRVRVYPYYSSDGELHMELEITETQRSVPGDGIVLNAADTAALLAEFALDYADPTIDMETFCDLYFAGGINCIEGREEVFEFGGTVVFTGLEELLDYNNEPFYLAEFEFFVDGVLDYKEGPFRVWQLADGNHFIEFVDYYLPIDPLDLDVADFETAKSMYLNYLADYINLYYDDQYMCEVYFRQYDTSFNCVEGRTAFVEAGGYTVLLSFEQGLDINGYTYYIAHYEQYNGVDPDPVVWHMDFYAYFDEYGDPAMLPVDPLDLPIDPPE